MTIIKPGYFVTLADEFADNLFRFEIESKGYLRDTKLHVEGGNSYEITFYDTTRFKQDADDELQDGNVCFYQKNIVLVPTIDEQCILNAIQHIYTSKLYSSMVPTPHS